MRIEFHFTLLSLTILSFSCAVRVPVLPASGGSTLKQGLEQGQTAPTFFIQTLEGEAFYLSRVVGRKAKTGSRKPLVLSFFQTTAIPCRLEISELEKLQIAYPEVAIYLVNLNEDVNVVQRYISTNNLSLEILMDKYGTLGKKYEVVNASGLAQLPNTFFINESGIVHYHATGFRPGDEQVYAQKLSELTERTFSLSDAPEVVNQPREEDIDYPEDVSVPINIAVMNLDAIGISSTEALALTNRLRVELFDTGRLVILERGKMTEILEEQGFQETGCTTNDCLVKVGRLLNVQQMVAGSVSKVANIFSIELRLVDVETGEIVAATVEDVTGSLGDLLIHGVQQAARELVQ